VTDIYPSPRGGQVGAPPQQLADVLERVLDKGIVIAGDIQVRLLDIELLTIKIRLLVASVDRAREMGIDWWEKDAFVSSLARGEESSDGTSAAELDRRLKELEHRVAAGDGSGDGSARPVQAEADDGRR
jgi:hypothetical protein